MVRDQVQPEGYDCGIGATVPWGTGKAHVCTQGRYGPVPDDDVDQRQATEVAQGAAALVSMVGAFLDGAIDVPKVRTITSVSVNRRTSIAVTDIVPALEGLMGKQTARAVQAVFGIPPKARRPAQPQAEGVGP